MADQRENTGLFLQTTQIWDINQNISLDPGSTDFRDLVVRLYQQLNNIALTVNLKKTGYYLTETFNNSTQWFNPNSTNPLQLRPGFTKVVDIGPLGGGVTNTAHGISIVAGSTIKFTYIGGAAVDSVGLVFVPLPHANGGATDIIVTVNATNVVITNNSGIVFTSAYIVLEYLEF